MQYKTVTLVEGWLVESSSKKNTVNWKCRQPSDCKTDLEHFLSNLIDEVSKRIDNSLAKGVVELYKAMDLSRMITTTGGKWCEAMEVPLTQPTTEEDLVNFRKFYSYVKSLQHGTQMEDDADVVFMQVMAAFK